MPTIVDESITLSRRCILLGIGGAAILSACGNPSKEPTGGFSFAATEDPLADLRFQADALPTTWMNHLDLPSLTKKPQMLALSGGGEDGAFGAGALSGWSKTGNRPDFDIVTGVSTGALIAPMAFLGSSYDETLEHMFLDHDADDIMNFRLLSMAFAEGLYDTTPLAELIEHYAPNRLVDAVARKHAIGGRLFVVTSNLNTSNAVVWNMGALAKARQYDLFRSVIRASGALPGLFPPVKVRVVDNGATVTETHIDGGVQMQVLASPPAAFAFESDAARGGHAYVIVNNTLKPEPQASAKSAIGISQQAMTTMIRKNAASEVNTARMLSQHHGLGFSYTCVTADSGVIYDPGDRFSAEYMAALFAHGYDRATSGSLWQT